MDKGLVVLCEWYFHPCITNINKIPCKIYVSFFFLEGKNRNELLREIRKLDRSYE